MTERSGNPLLRHVPGPVREFGSFVLFAIRRFFADNLSQAAAALTYTTLLALVPLLVITFAILSGFPAFDEARERMREIVFTFLVPEATTEATEYIRRFTSAASNLTAVGVVALAITSVMLLSTIEFTLNRVWRVERPRALGIRILTFWTILTMGPLLLGASFALTSNPLPALSTWLEGGGEILGEVSRQSRPGLLWIADAALLSVVFTLIFKLVPARRVRVRDAAIGGLVAGVAFKILAWGFNSFLTSGSTYETIYGALAVFPIFLLWLYASWTVVLFGAVFAASFPDWWAARTASYAENLVPSERLAVAMAVLGTFYREAQEGGALSHDALEAAVPLQARNEVMEQLRETGYVVVTEADELFLARDLHRTTVADLARDLGISLIDRPGERPDGEKVQIPDSLFTGTGTLAPLLRRVAEAETAILGEPVAKVLTSREEDLPKGPRIAAASPD